MNLKEALDYGKNNLINTSEDYMTIVKILIEHVFNIKKEEIVVSYNMELEPHKVYDFTTYIDKIKSGYPVQYITNKQEFMGLQFYVDDNVLIPQPDTEILVQEVIEAYSKKECKILDLCTGSGAIAISLAKYIENANVVATDVSNKAIQIAKLNAEKNMVRKKIEFIESDMFNNVKYKDFDVIVSNPPYIKTDVISKLDKQVQSEPFIALDGGDDGLKFYRIIADGAKEHLKKDGKLFLEIGYDQKEEVTNILKQKYINIYCKKDLAQNDRIIVAEMRD